MHAGIPGLATVALVAALALTPLAAGANERSVVLGGETIRFSQQLAAPGDGATDAGTPSARATARALHRFLTAGDIESAALLSNAPRRRYELFTEYLGAVGDAEFRRVFAEYFDEDNRAVAELAIGAHRLLIWKLKAPDHVAGQYYVDVEGRMLLDDVPSEARSRLRRLLEAYRAGALRLD